MRLKVDVDFAIVGHVRVMVTQSRAEVLDRGLGSEAGLFGGHGIEAVPLDSGDLTVQRAMVLVFLEDEASA